MQEKAVHCKFGLLYAEPVHDQIINGTSNLQVREKLLAYGEALTGGRNWPKLRGVVTTGQPHHVQAEEGPEATLETTGAHCARGLSQRRGALASTSIMPIRRWGRLNLLTRTKGLNQTRRRRREVEQRRREGKTYRVSLKTSQWRRKNRSHREPTQEEISMVT